LNNQFIIKICRWYTKANQINPKNGRPYNQLALLAVYEKRKLDAVYYYMRSLMASNPFQSAKDSLLSLFEEYRRKVSSFLILFILFFICIFYFWHSMN